MTDPTLTISIDRTSLTLAAFVLTGHSDATRDLSVSDYQEPAMQPRITYAPSSDDVPDMPLGWTWQESILGFNVFADGAATEAVMRAKIAELTAAVARLSYETTVTVDGATPEIWTCRPGSVTPVGGRTLADLRLHNPVWSVAIPVYPVRST